MSAPASFQTWVPNRHLQTLLATYSRSPQIPYQRERWSTPDHDFIDLDWLNPPDKKSTQPLIVLFHGLEGSAASSYARHLMFGIQQHHWHGVVPHFRSCSGTPNRLPRFYHMGDAAEIAWILTRLRTYHQGAIYAVGVSLGGSALLHYLGEYTATILLTGAAAVSVPLDLIVSGFSLDHGLNRIYTTYFLNLLKQKALTKLNMFPGLFDRQKLDQAHNFYAFDQLITAPLHGFKSTEDYWRTASSIRQLPKITLPTLLINAKNDPFMPAYALPQKQHVSQYITLEQPKQGGHVGFINTLFSTQTHWLTQRLIQHFLQC